MVKKLHFPFTVTVHGTAKRGLDGPFSLEFQYFLLENFRLWSHQDYRGFHSFLFYFSGEMAGGKQLLFFNLSSGRYSRCGKRRLFSRLCEDIWSSSFCDVEQSELHELFFCCAWGCTWSDWPCADCRPHGEDWNPLDIIPNTERFAFTWLSRCMLCTGWSYPCSWAEILGWQAYARVGASWCTPAVCCLSTFSGGGFFQVCISNSLRFSSKNRGKDTGYLEGIFRKQLAKKQKTKGSGTLLLTPSLSYSRLRHR